MRDSHSIQHTLDNQELPENYVRCIKSIDNYYLVIPKNFKDIHKLYKMQIIGTTLCFKPIIDYKR